MQSKEHLVAVAIIRDGVTHRMEKEGQHWQVRLQLGDEWPNAHKLGDKEGFITSTGRFVDRYEASEVAADAGQVREFERGTRLLSTCLNW